MICKKCGANIDESSKFCGYCGEKVTDIQSEVSPVQNNEQTLLNVTETNNSLIEQTNIGEQNVSQETENTVQSSTSIEQTVVNVEDSKQNNDKKSNKNNKVLFLVLGVVLAVVAAVLVILAFNKTASNSISVLEKAMNNLVSKGENSGTINTKILIEDNTSNSINLSALVKYSKTNDNYNFEFKLEKSMLFDEISFFLNANKNSATIYANSNTIDLMGSTKSNVNMWVYYLLDLSEMSDDFEIPESKEINLKGILDEKHFKYVDKTNNVNHYKLVIDKELLEKIKTRMPDEYKKEMDTITLFDSYELDFYINDSNELVRISMDLADEIGADTLKSAIISFDFEDFGNTNVVIPADALNSKMDIEKYMSTYKVGPSVDEDTDLGFNNLDMSL